MMLPILCIVIQCILTRGLANGGDVQYTYTATAVTEGVDKITLFWEAAISVGGQKFEIHTMPADVPKITTDQQYLVIDNLKSSISYEFTVYLVHADGQTKTPVAYTRGQTISKDDENPTDLTARVVNSTYLRLDWNEAKLSNRQPPLYTIVSISHSGTTQTTETLTQYITNLEPSTKYTFLVRSTRSDGVLYQPGAAIEVTTWDTVEKNPSEAYAIPCSPTSIRIFWKAAAQSDTSPKLYTILTNSDVHNTLQTLETEIEIGQLLPATEYTFTVFSTARSGKLYLPGAKAHARTFAKDPEYTYKLIVVTEGFDKLTAFWEESSGEVARGRRFLVTTTPADVPPIITEQQKVELEKLKPSTLYQITVNELLSNGTAKTPAMHKSGSTFGKFDNILSELTATVLSSSSVQLNWKPARSSDLQTPLYTIEISSRPGQPITTEKTTYDIANLLAGEPYVFTVRSTKLDGSFYRWALMTTASTWHTADTNPTDVSAVPLSSTSIRLTWKAPKKPDHSANHYTIITNSDYKNAQKTGATTIDLDNLSPATEYAFTVHSTSSSEFLFYPGGHATGKTTRA